MPRPLALCLEDLNPRAAPRYLRCVALSGRESGLRLDGGGTVLWKSDDATACELWVSADDRLILFRRAGGVRVVVRRTGRVLDVPEEKPVVLLDQDQLAVGGRTLRMHVHGPAVRIHAPTPLAEPAGGGLGRAAATAVALGAALGAADCRKAEPTGSTPEDGSGAQQPQPATPGSDADAVLYVPAAAEAGGEAGPPIEIRDRPPEMVALRAPEPAGPDGGASSESVGAPDGGTVPVAGPDAGADVFVLEVAKDPEAAAGDASEPDDARRIEVRIRPPRPVLRNDES